MANPIMPIRKRNKRIFNTPPITFKYFNLSFLIKLIMQNINPKKQLEAAVKINHLGIIGKPSLALIVEGIEFTSRINKISVNAEKVKDNLEYKVLQAFPFASLFTITCSCF